VKRARGFGLVAQLIAGAVVAALAAGAFAYYNHVVSERAKLELELSDAVKAQQEEAAVTTRLRDDIKARDKLLADRERTRQRDEQEKGALHAELEDLKKQPAVAAWMAGAVPAAVLDRVRGRPADDQDAGGKAVPARQPGPANVRAAPAR
jgi:hypothetical protein